jgi:hypothetical protein
MADEDIRSKVSELSGEVKTIYELIKPVMDRKIILNESEYALIKEAHSQLFNKGRDIDTSISVANILLGIVINAVEKRTSEEG